MDATFYSYDGKLWTVCPTTQDNNSFFHSVFGVRSDTDQAYFDKHSRYRRMRWATFFTYYINETTPVRLEETLSTIGTAQNLTRYVSQIIAADRNVTLEEIPILAVLDNVRIVLLSRTEAVRIVKPDTGILGNYPVPSMVEELSEIVLCLDGTMFTRLEPVTNQTNIETLKITQSISDTGVLSKYKKGGSAGSKGIQYQVTLTTLVLLNAFKTEERWKMSTENMEAEKFDDIVLESGRGYTFLQCKHRDTRKITLDELTSADSKNEAFSLPKYLKSYLNLRGRFPMKNVIICTNATVQQKALMHLRRHQAPPDSVLYHDDGDNLFYTLNDDILLYFAQSLQVDEAEVREFSQRLQMYFNHSPINRLKVAINKLLSGTPYCNNSRDRISFTDLYQKIMDWFQQKNGIYLTESYAKTMFADIWRDKYTHRLEQYKITFENASWSFSDSIQAFHVVCEQTLLQTIRIYYMLQDHKWQILFVRSEDDLDMRTLAMDAFQFPSYVYLIIIENDNEEIITEEAWKALKNTLQRYSYKKIILIGNDMGQDYYRVDGTVTFQDLSHASQRRLLNKKIVDFQGMGFTLKGLLGTQPTTYYSDVLTPDVLEKTVRGDKIKVGSIVEPFNEEIASYYTPRMFRRDDETVSEENLYDINEKFVIIENRGGMGKTTVLKHLAATIKMKHPHLWVVRLEFNKYADILKEYLKKNRETISLTELLNYRDNTKLETEFERRVFSSDGKIVLILDGVDEIDEDIDPYLDLVFRLLERCREAPNITKVFLAGREHAIHTLPEKLNVIPFRLLPFTEDDYVAFFTNFWTYKLRLTGTDSDRCRAYSKTVVSKMRSWINPDFNPDDRMVVVPLQLKMLAEIFQESGRFDATEEWDGCVEFLDNDNPIPKLPRRVNIAKLFKTLIEKKEDFLIDSDDTKADGQLRKYNEYFAYRKML